MATMSISLSDKMREQIRERVQSGDYHNESEYIRDLIRRDVEKKIVHAELLAMLENADQGSNSRLSMNEIKAAAKAELNAKK